MKRITIAALALLVACSSQTTGPTESDSLILVPDFANSSAVEVDAAGVGGSRFPEDIALTAEQKAAIAALHQEFREATAADIEALHAIEAEARAAHQAGQSREEIRAILERARPILERLHQAFAELKAAIWEVYTPEQRAWIEAHRPAPCGTQRPPPLTDEQKQQIRALQEAFMDQVREAMVRIRQIVQEAHEAAQAGASREEIQAILHQAEGIKQEIRRAERQLQADIDAVLTEAQRAGKCR